MESRGFGAYKNRVFYRDVNLTRLDYTFLGAYFIYLVLFTIMLAYLGMLGKLFYLVG